MRKSVFIASDHAGFALKEFLISGLTDCEVLVDANANANDADANACRPVLDLRDLGTYSGDQSCDYPIFVNELVSHVLSSKDRYGILICGSGIGMSIAANRVRGIRAALCFNEHMSEMSRKHNDANVIVFGASVIPFVEALRCVIKFMETSFEGGRHKRRIDMIDGAC